MDNQNTPPRFKIDPAANDYTMALCRAIGDCLAAAERSEPAGPVPVRVPGWEAASTPWTLRAGDVVPKWRLDRHEGGRLVHALAFASNIDEAAIAMLRYDRLNPLVTAETLWPETSDDVTREGVAAHA